MELEEGSAASMPDLRWRRRWGEEGEVVKKAEAEGSWKRWVWEAVG